ncbi:hypothetical protein F5890DRAFT_159707 [Lentinula detonsa]|uniref:Uncharacterized protein n=1 Tax=Lentinula detonsa TaxID=2804962 RepID=A0AA38PYL2_9AGAR|nr:hypothetical protein F5890DRAFT_159707 [Lentinula detonsa]
MTTARLYMNLSSNSLMLMLAVRAAQHLYPYPSYVPSGLILSSWAKVPVRLLSEWPQSARLLSGSKFSARLAESGDFDVDI